MPADRTEPNVPADVVAAIDLGSNSFHMIVARMTDGQLQVVDRLREMVQLAAGLDKKNYLSTAAQDRAFDCLGRFGQRVRHMPRSRVRIVGTNTLRRARNGSVFLAKAEAVLNHPVEIISGVEEARLIYLGVAHSTPARPGRRLVVDIGGGSTELITGEQFEPLHLESLEMGCVSMTQRYFAEGRIRETELGAAELAVRLELEPVALGYRELGWQQAIGASGTIRAIHEIVLAENWSPDGITPAALRRLRSALLEAGKAAEVAARWRLQPERAQVLTGGFVILHGLCEALSIDRMQLSDGALREGVIYDLVGRIRHEDVRHRTVAVLSRRYSVDTAQAKRVAASAQRLLAQAQVSWNLMEDEWANSLEWAARLHEIGLAIAHGQYHKHGAYILEHADMPGFSRSAQALLAVLIRGHRRKFPLAALAALPAETATAARRLCVLLRLAVLLHRSRSRQPLPMLALKVSERQIELYFPPAWLEAHPLTYADLEQEAQYLKKADFKLMVQSCR